MLKAGFEYFIGTAGRVQGKKIPAKVRFQGEAWRACWEFVRTAVRTGQDRKYVLAGRELAGQRWS
jgi:hypothetical protein